MRCMNCGRTDADDDVRIIPNKDGKTGICDDCIVKSLGI